MTEYHSNVGTGLDPERLFATIDDLAPLREARSVGNDIQASPTPAEYGRALGRHVGRSVGEAMGAEIGAILAPLLTGIDDLEEIYSGSSGARESVASNSRAGGTDDPDSRADEDESADDDSDTVHDEGDGETRLDDEDLREEDGPTPDQNDGRDAWGRREVGAHWPLPAESRLPMDP